MKYYSFLLFILWLVPISKGQDSLALDYCQQQAMNLSPLQKQIAYFESIYGLKKQNITSGNKPQFNLSGQLSYQSDVFMLPFSIPGTETPEIPKEQYKTSLEISQKLYDGGIINYSSQLEKVKSEIEKQSVVVELNKIKEIVNTLFFNALVLQENQKLLELVVLKELESQLKIMKSRIANGVAMKSNATGLEIQILKTKQQIFSIEKDKKTMLSMLGKWMEKDLETAVLKVPEIKPQIINNYMFNRPEYQLFDLKKQHLNTSQLLTDSKRKPKVFAFANAGVGNPNPFNLFETELSGFYITGLKISWNPFDFKNSQREKEILEVNKNLIDIQKENLDKNLQIALVKEIHEVQKLRQLITKDKEIILLHEKMVKQATSQLQHGVITSTNYITEVNAKTQAKLNLQIHELQLIHAQVNQITIKGNSIN